MAAESAARRIGLIIVGDEILSGRRQDKHFSKVVELLSARGMQLGWAEILPDDRDTLVATYKRSFATGDVVFSCGGIGGTLGGLVGGNRGRALAAIGGNNWVETYESGQPVFGAPTDGNFGALRSGALEDSNVDLTAELVNMMTAQRAYQANAQTIKTQDQIFSTLVNLR